MNVKPRLLQSFDDAEPHRPDRIDQDIGVVSLNQKGGVTDPGDANLARLHFWEQRTRVSGPGTLGEERWDPNAGEEITPGPIAAGAKLHSLRFFRAGFLRVANYLPLSRKRIRHRTEPYKS